MHVTKRSLLQHGVLFAGSAVFPIPLLSSRHAAAQDPFTAIAIVYEAFVTVVGFLDSRKFSTDVRSGLDDIKAQLVIIDAKIDEVLGLLRSLPAEIQRLLENNSREESARRILAIERSLVDEFAGIQDLTKIPPDKRDRILHLSTQLKTEGYYLAEWGPIGYAYVARAFIDNAVAFLLLRESKEFLRSFGTQYLQYMIAFRDKFDNRLRNAEETINQNQKYIDSYPKVVYLGSVRDDCSHDALFTFGRDIPDREPREPRRPPCRDLYTVYFGDFRMGENGRWTGSIGSKRSNSPNPDNWPWPPGVNLGSPDQMHYQAQELLNSKTAVVRREGPIASNLRPHVIATAKIAGAIQDFVRNQSA